MKNNLKSIFLFLFAFSFLITIPHIVSGEENNTSSNNILTNFKIPDLSQTSFNTYFDRILQNIAGESSVYDIIGFSLGIVIYGIFIFHFYRFLARRNMFGIDIEGRISGKYRSSGEKVSAAPRIAAHIATNFLIFPIVIFVWFLVYSLFLFFMAQGVKPEIVFLVTSALVIAIRMAAYYNEDLAKDLAKLLPFSMLGVFLLSPTFFTIDEVRQRLTEFPQFIIMMAVFIILAVIIEVVFSTAYLLKLRFFGTGKKKKQVSDSEHPI